MIGSTQGIIFNVAVQKQTRQYSRHPAVHVQDNAEAATMIAGSYHQKQATTVGN
jgi:hypothetical protein